MSIANLYFSLLPKTYLAKAYMCMCFIKHWLNTNGMTDFKAETIAEASENLFDVQLIGTTLRNLKCVGKDRYKQKIRRYYWNAESVYRCTHTWGIPAWHLDYCRNVHPVENELIIDKNTSKSAISDKNLKVMVGSAGHITTPCKRLLAEHNLSNIDYYSYLWNKAYKDRYDFKISYSFVNNLYPILIETFNSRGKIWLTEEISPCLEIPSNYLEKIDGYPILNQALLNKLNLSKEMYNPKSFPTSGIHRLVAMTNNPTLDWHLPRHDSSTYMTAHHTCFNRACVNPKHIMPMTEDKHTELHNKLRDDHIYNDPTQNFQPIIPTTHPIDIDEKVPCPLEVDNSDWLEFGEPSTTYEEAPY